MKRFKTFLLFAFSFCLLISCSVQKQLSKKAHTALIDKEDVASAHIGISIFDADNGKYVYNYEGDKYFIPASNTKLFTLYAGLKYLHDSLVAARYIMQDGTVFLQATGDPTFLHPDFKNQPLLNFLQRKEIKKVIINTSFASAPFGMGWSWDDYPYDYMAERDPFPIYGDLATFIFDGDSIRTIPPVLKQFVSGMPVRDHIWSVNRQLAGHFFTIDTANGTLKNEKQTTMAMEKGLFAARYLADTLRKEAETEHGIFNVQQSIPVYSQPKDSLFKIMMHRSDNFFAEQTLLMAGNEYLGEMNDRRMIDTLLHSDLKDLPQKPSWVDGSGLSHYNLFSPQDFIWLLNKLKNEFGLERLKVILPGANDGTIEGLYKNYEQHIYVKTGTVSNNLALSGYLITKKNRLLIFSVLVGNHKAINSSVRKEIESFITYVIDKY